MGYLNSDTVTVDAILTKHGRRLLAEGGGLGITKFGLSDDGIDYNLWNTAHPSGSAYYGLAIENLPQIEAVPDDSAIMRYKLVTLDRNTVFMPLIRGLVQGGTYTLETQQDGNTIQPITENGTDNEYEFKISDISALTITGATRLDISGTTVSFPASQEVFEAAAFIGPHIQITAKPTDVQRTVSIQITGMNTGATAQVDVSVLRNIDQSVAQTGGTGA